jgi:hypothetical protein
MKLLPASVFFFLAGLFLTGCSSGELPGGPRFETSPVTGTIHIDGVPAELVEVECHPAPDSTGIKYPISTMTDKDGVFTLTTYESSDGLPEGTYTLSFKWLEPGLVPRDKLKGAFSDPKRSQHKITVVKGQETVIGIVELSSKGSKK